MGSRAAFHLRHRQGTQPAGMGGDWPRTGAARFSPADDGKIQRAGIDQAKAAPRSRNAGKSRSPNPPSRRKPKSTTSAKSPATRCCSTACAQLRKQLADERDVPAYIIFSDVSLRQMARNYPARRKRIRPHQRRRRKEAARVRRDFSRRDRRAFADERPPDFCRRFLHRVRRAATVARQPRRFRARNLAPFPRRPERRANRPRTRRDRPAPFSATSPKALNAASRWICRNFSPSRNWRKSPPPSTATALARSVRCLNRSAAKLITVGCGFSAQRPTSGSRTGVAPILR